MKNTVQKILIFLVLPVQALYAESTHTVLEDRTTDIVVESKNVKVTITATDNHGQCEVQVQIPELVYQTMARATSVSGLFDGTCEAEAKALVQRLKGLEKDGKLTLKVHNQISFTKTAGILSPGTRDETLDCLHLLKEVTNISTLYAGPDPHAGYGTSRQHTTLSRKGPDAHTNCL